MQILYLPIKGREFDWILCALAVSCAAIYVGAKQLNKQKKTIHSIDDLTKGLSQKIVQSETVEVALRGLAKAIDEIEEQRIKLMLFANNLLQHSIHSIME